MRFMKVSMLHFNNLTELGVFIFFIKSEPRHSTCFAVLFCIPNPPPPYCHSLIDSSPTHSLPLSLPPSPSPPLSLPPSPSPSPSFFLLSAPQVVTTLSPTVHLPRLMASLGMTPLGGPHAHIPGSDAVSVLLDGRVLGEASKDDVAELALKLRTLKALGKENVSF